MYKVIFFCAKRLTQRTFTVMFSLVWMFTHTNHFFFYWNFFIHRIFTQAGKIRSSFAIINCENFRNYFWNFYNKYNMYKINLNKPIYWSTRQKQRIPYKNELYLKWTDWAQIFTVGWYRGWLNIFWTFDNSALFISCKKIIAF